MKVLLTGANGFVGKNIFQQLKENHTVIPVFGKKDFDLTDEEQCETLIKEFRPDTVVHLAGSVGGIKANMMFPGDFIYENLKMGMNMIHQSSRNHVSKFILVGTVCSYPKYTTVPFREEDFWFGYPEETNAPYGVAKKALGEMLKAYCNQYNMNGTYLVPTNMYGPHDNFDLNTSHVIPALIRKMYEAQQYDLDHVEIWGPGLASREFLYAEDFADAVNAAIKIDTGLEPINVGTGVETRIVDIAKEIARCLNYEGALIFDKKLDGQPRRRLETTRAEKILGFKAKTSLEEGLDKTIEWYCNKQKENLI